MNILNISRIVIGLTAQKCLLIILRKWREIQKQTKFQSVFNSFISLCTRLPEEILIFMKCAAVRTCNAIVSYKAKIGEDRKLSCQDEVDLYPANF